MQQLKSDRRHIRYSLKIYLTFPMPLGLCTNLVFFLPVLKQLHESVALLHQLRVHAFHFCKRQDGFQSTLHLAGCPEPSAGGGESVIHQPLLVFNHFFKYGRLTLHSAHEESLISRHIFKQTARRFVKVLLNLRVGKQLGLVICEEFVSFAEHTTKTSRKHDHQPGVMKTDS